MESYILRAVGISFVMLAWLEFRIIRDLERHRDLAIIYGLTSALFFVTIVVQTLLRGFNGAQWYWWGKYFWRPRRRGQSSSGVGRTA